MTPSRITSEFLVRVFSAILLVQLSRAYPHDQPPQQHREGDNYLHSLDHIGTVQPLKSKYTPLPCGGTSQLRVNESLIIEAPRRLNSRSLTSQSECKWRFLFSSCRLAISCPSIFSLSSRSLCDTYLEVNQGSGKTGRVCAGRSLDLSNDDGDVEVTYRTTTSILSGLGLRCRLTCAGQDGAAANPGSSRPVEQIPEKIADPTNCTCGLANDNIIKIINGVETKVNEFPWMAGLVRVGGSIPFCGAALISSKYILTAAHCVAGRTPKNLEVVLNDHNILTGSETKIYRKKVESIISHSSYTNRLDYDAALIKVRDGMEKEMEEGKIVPVCLPQMDGLRNTYEGQSVTVSGWGLVGETSAQSPVLRKTDVTVVTDKTCRLSYPGSITARMMCAAAPMKDACQGDSGGPLVHRKDEQYTQVGVVSWGHGCARPNKPGVYSRVTEFMPWIMRLTTDGSFCLTKEERIKLLESQKRPTAAPQSVEVSSQEVSSNEKRASQEDQDASHQPTSLEQEQADAEPEPQDDEYDLDSLERPQELSASQETSGERLEELQDTNDFQPADDAAEVFYQ